MSAASHLLPNGQIRRQKPKLSVANTDISLFEGTGAKRSPLGLLPVPNVAQTDRLGFLPVPNVAQTDRLGFKEKDSWFSPSFLTPEKPRFFYSRQTAAYAERMEKIVDATLPLPLSSKRQGIALHQFRSGELTGGRFTTGLDSQTSAPRRTGALITQSLTQKSRTKIRRAIQNADHDFKCFMTVTFDTANMNQWELNPDGSVRHDFAKYKFKKFLHSIYMCYSRKAAKSGRDSDRIAYVWVAEVQLKSTNNIHFHVLLNHRVPIKWLTTLWGQASNSIDVRSINNLNHASCYIRKYMEKDKSPVHGNRYGITQGLRETMQPEKIVIDGRERQKNVFEIIREFSDTIQINGGKVLEHGFYLPTPCRSVTYRGKDGKTKKTVAVNARLPVFLLQEILELFNSFPF